MIFDWDGTAVANRSSRTTTLRRRLHRLSLLGIHTAVVSGTNLTNVDRQLQAGPRGPGRMWLALNRGAELFEVTASGPELLSRHAETAGETKALDHAAEVVAAELSARGLRVAIVSKRLNRRKIDLIPEPEWADPPKSRIAELLRAVSDRVRSAGLGSLGEVVVLVQATVERSGLVSARVTSDGKHVEIGLSDKSDSMRALLDRLDREGIAGELILVVGDEFGDLGGIPGSDSRLLVPDSGTPIVVSVGPEPYGVPPNVRHLGGGPLTFGHLLDEQLRRAAKLRVPAVCRDPRWTIEERGVGAPRHRVTESLFTLSSGGIGIRGSTEDNPEFGHPLVTATGVYAGGGVHDGLLGGPAMLEVHLDPPVREDVRVLDLRTGVLQRSEQTDPRDTDTPLRSLRFASLGVPRVVAMRVEAATTRLRARQTRRPETWVAVSGTQGGIGAVCHQERRRDGPTATLERLVSLDANPRGAPDEEAARARLTSAQGIGFEALLATQRSAWGDRWDRVGIEIPDDPVTELGLRFALFQLWGLTGAEGDELPVGARALTGDGYCGHVFWDADVFVLPALVTIDPRAADAMVRYRINRLGAARKRAAAEGREGARFPWESARDGQDVTPTHGYVGSEAVPILNGPFEEHVNAGVAWSIVHNATWSRPRGGLRPDEADVLGATARYWASRATTSDDGRAHIEGVIGPDEYHELVDDNAFTNVMAAWNLRTAAARAPATEVERARWRDLAEALVDGYDPASGVYEQFRGYFGLNPLLVRDVAEPPVAADVLLGHAATARSQIIKQADALMIHQLVPDHAFPGSLASCLAYYAPRTAHGSSLSPAVMAALHARAGQPDAALRLLRLSLSIDLDDLGGTTAAGVHIGACAGAWTAVIAGFLGARVVDGRLRLDPILPTTWHQLQVRFRCLDTEVRLHLDDDCIQAEAGRPLTVEIGSGQTRSTRTSSEVTFTRGEKP